MNNLQSISIPVNLLPRPCDAHKGSMGHALLISGQRGMAGAAILTSRACLRSGVGKLTVATPSYNIPILQVSVPEAIISPSGDNEITQIVQTTQFQAVAIGPGLGTAPETAAAVLAQIKECHTPIVVDADAINILAQYPDALPLLPADSILTPHIGELTRLIGNTSSADERLRLTLELSQRLHIYIIIKGADSTICCPDGTTRVNHTGNPGMATAGSSDVLTGILLGLLTRGYSPLEAAQLGVYLHGLAGDIAAQHLGMESLIASDIVDHLPSAFLNIQNNKTDIQ